MSMQLRVGPDGQVFATKATGTPSGTAPVYGAGGLFGICGAHPTLVNAMVGPAGYGRMLRWVGSNEESPIYDALTYIGSDSDEQVGYCGDCGKPELRECPITYVWGRACQQTNEHAVDQLGMHMNRGVPRVAMFGPITDPAGNVMIPQGQEITDRFTLEVGAVGYNLRRMLGAELWTADPANNLPGSGHWEPYGFGQLINTNKQTIFGALCENLDSIVRNFGSAVIGATGAPNIVNEVAALVRSSNYRVSGANLDPNSIVGELVMHPRHWEQVATRWACDYGLSCGAGSGTTEFNNALDLANLRDKYMRELALPIDGHDIPVVLDNQIPLTPLPYGDVTKHCGSIYYIVREVDGMTVTFGEFQNFDQTAGSAMGMLRQIFGSVPIAFTDGGRYAVAPTMSGGFCFDVRMLTKWRIIMIMPWTSGVLTNVCAVPLGVYPDVTGSGGTYELTGGISSKPYMGLYPPVQEDRQ